MLVAFHHPFLSKLAKECNYIGLMARRGSSFLCMNLMICVLLLTVITSPAAYPACHHLPCIHRPSDHAETNNDVLSEPEGYTTGINMHLDDAHARSEPVGDSERKKLATSGGSTVDEKCHGYHLTSEPAAAGNTGRKMRLSVGVDGKYCGGYVTSKTLGYTGTKIHIDGNGQSKLVGGGGKVKMQGNNVHMDGNGQSKLGGGGGNVKMQVTGGEN